VAKRGGSTTTEAVAVAIMKTLYTAMAALLFMVVAAAAELLIMTIPLSLRANLSLVVMEVIVVKMGKLQREVAVHSCLTPLARVMAHKVKLC